MKSFLYTLLLILSSIGLFAQEGFELSLSAGPGQAYTIINNDSSKNATSFQLSLQAGLLLNEKFEVFGGLQYWSSGFNTSIQDETGMVLNTSNYYTIGIPIGARYYITDNFYGAVRIIPSLQYFAKGSGDTSEAFFYEFNNGSMNDFHLFGEINIGYEIHLSDNIDIDFEPRLMHSISPIFNAENVNGNLFEYGINVRIQYNLW